MFKRTQPFEMSMLSSLYCSRKKPNNTRPPLAGAKAALRRPALIAANLNKQPGAGSQNAANLLPHIKAPNGLGLFHRKTQQVTGANHLAIICARYRFAYSQIPFAYPTVPAFVRYIHPTICLANAGKSYILIKPA